VVGVGGVLSGGAGLGFGLGLGFGGFGFGIGLGFPFCGKGATGMGVGGVPPADLVESTGGGVPSPVVHHDPPCDPNHGDQTNTQQDVAVLVAA